MNKRIMHIIAERDAAVEERNRAISEKNAALDERDAAIQQRDTAISERDSAIRERDNAIAALQFQESTMNSTLGCGIQRGTKRMHQPTNHPANVAEASYKTREPHITDAFPISAISSEAVKSRQAKRTKENKAVPSKTSKSPRKGKKVGEDLNRHVTTAGSKAEWDAQDLGSMNQVNFDEATMQTPICSCTGVPRQCYKWGNGGWQSSCCTTTLSVYPLPQMPNKRHARMGGRKMSGSVFTRLLSRLAVDGHDLSMPLDLKNYWAKHGTNRYITINMSQEEPGAAPPLLVSKIIAFFHLPNPQIFQLFIISSTATFSLGIALIIEWVYHGRHHPGYHWIIYYAPSMIALAVLAWIICLISAAFLDQKDQVHHLLPIIDQQQNQQLQDEIMQLEVAQALHDEKAVVQLQPVHGTCDLTNEPAGAGLRSTVPTSEVKDDDDDDDESTLKRSFSLPMSCINIDFRKIKRISSFS
ncbi:hypothetical protein F0562_028514 [Nyssa sinensis]|uniref:GAGA-binding transcriptional activator n=1 Tax=Nyssa sinensis TaxID=561372 RepID=A0A5J5B1H7_9ASTE|nr:hypothetical protein F0562_028514 [Nyssa sinensis]